MTEIHRYFRAGFGEAVPLIRGVRTGDVQHADVVAGHLAALSTALHAHHEFEDGHFWDPLSARGPACALHVERMKQQHAVMLTHLEELDRTLPVWRHTGRPSDAARVISALNGINDALAAHLPDEEKNIVPVLEEVFEQKDMEAAAEHGRRAMPKGYMFRSLGAILAAQPDGGASFLRTNLPAPVRLVWRVYGQRKYRAHREALLSGPS